MFSNPFKRKRTDNEIKFKKPQRLSKQKVFLYKAEVELVMKDQTVGRFPVTVSSYSRAKANQDLSRELKLKITKIHRA